MTIENTTIAIFATAGDPAAMFSFGALMTSDPTQLVTVGT
jgi:hypothetical protein